MNICDDIILPKHENWDLQLQLEKFINLVLAAAEAEIEVLFLLHKQLQFVSLNFAVLQRVARNIAII